MPSGTFTATRLTDIENETARQDVDIKVIGSLAIYKTSRAITTLRNAGVAAITKNLADERVRRASMSPPFTWALPAPSAPTQKQPTPSVV